MATMVIHAATVALVGAMSKAADAELELADALRQIHEQIRDMGGPMTARAKDLVAMADDILKARILLANSCRHVADMKAVQANETPTFQEVVAKLRLAGHVPTRLYVERGTARLRHPLNANDVNRAVSTMTNRTGRAL